MVKINTQVHKCARKSDESIKSFIERFKVLAFAYIKIVKADSHSSESQIFAMTLLINDKLGDQLFANTIGTLINSINSTSKTEEKTICIRKDRLKVIVNHATEAGSE